MIQDKAIELGRVIGQSDEYKAMKRSGDALGEDKAAVAVLQELEGLRRQAGQMINAGQEPTPDMEQRLETLLGQVQASPNYQRAMVAQENFDKLMMRVNEWISEGIRKGATSGIITLT
jgi:cell fate (sporulation/competence/biofilm development) regulator YlbF (YheA/YmcA/DUF963 family)